MRTSHATSPLWVTALGLLCACGQEPEPVFMPTPEQENLAERGDERAAARSREERPAAGRRAPQAGHGQPEQARPPRVQPRERPTIPAPPDVSAPPEDAERTSSGLASKVLEAGRGDVHPSAEDVVRVHYTGWRAEDGEMFDSSVARGRPATFPLNRVIAGWTEGLQLMVEGEKRRLWIPANLAYEGQPSRPQGMLVFDVELLQIL